MRARARHSTRAWRPWAWRPLAWRPWASRPWAWPSVWRPWVWVVLMIGVVLGPRPAAAHSLSFGELRVVEQGEGQVEGTLRLAGSLDPRALSMDLGSGCTATDPPRWQRLDGEHVLRQRFDCGPAGLAGAVVGLRGDSRSEVQVVVRTQRADGGTEVHTVRGDESVALGRPEPAVDVLVRYGRLGVEHILGGFDHLLFVLGLVLLVAPTTRPMRRRLAWTITAFTLGHSLTLALTVLDVLRLRPAAVEAMIAASIVLLAVELRRPEAREGLTWRYPWLVAGGFGLLHGCGFAGALREVGLPEHALAVALAGFNVGVELGQLAFVAALGVGMAALGRVGSTSRTSAAAATYAMGGLACAWLLERVLALG